MFQYIVHVYVSANKLRFSVEKNDKQHQWLFPVVFLLQDHLQEEQNQFFPCVPTFTIYLKLSIDLQKSFCS